MPNLHSGCLVEGTIRLRSTGGRYSVCEHSVCTEKMISYHPIIFSVWQEDIILDLDVTPFIASSRSYFMGLNSVTNRA
jgi:hypothetical protein